MAIIENKATAVGDVILIEAEAPIIGLVGLTDFIDTVTGETASRYFRKEFRYSTTGGIQWSDWEDLTLLNLQAIPVIENNIFKIEYRYIREGSDIAGELGFNDITLQGNFTTQICGPTYQDSIFAQFFSCTDTQVLLWCINVSKKLYERGVVPNYIQRGDLTPANDKDYLDFWSTVACFFSLIVQYARQFETFYNHPELLLKYLRQRGLFICEMTGVEDMVYLMSHYLDEIRQRGTLQIIKKKGEDNKPVDGELLRLICFNKYTDEFIFHLVQNKYIGWKIGTSSPCYKGTKMQPELIKAYEQTKEVQNLNAYPLRQPSGSLIDIYRDNLNVNQIDIIQIDYDATQESMYIGLDISIDDINYTRVEVIFTNKPQLQTIQNLLFALQNSFGSFGTFQMYANNAIQVIWNTSISATFQNLLGIICTNTKQSYYKTLRIRNVAIGQKVGIGTLTDNVDDIDLSQYSIIIDPKLSYEITFNIKQTTNNTDITFGALSYDKNNTNQSLKRIDNNLPSNNFFTKLKLWQTNKYYAVRGIIFNSNTLPRVDGKGVQLELFKGANNSNHLQFTDEVIKIIPTLYIQNDSGNAGEVYIEDFKIRPLSTPHSFGFVNAPNFIQIWLKNNNASKSIQQIQDDIRRFLIPYNSSLYLIDLDNLSQKVVFKDFDFAVIRYIFTADAGHDLDTRTAIINVDISIDDRDVGYAREYQIGVNPNPYLIWGGDNTSSIGGEEDALINFKQLNIDYPNKNILPIRLRAYWYAQKLNGLITIQFQTYKGGTMQHVGTTFLNNGGTLVQTIEIQKVVNTYGNGSPNGDDLGVINYYPALKTAIIN